MSDEIPIGPGSDNYGEGWLGGESVEDIKKRILKDTSPIVEAAEKMDWGQVVANGGPPCFHLYEYGLFCGRTPEWLGHPKNHEFVSLADLIRGKMKK